jgi:hypothetical protein
MLARPGNLLLIKFWRDIMGDITVWSIVGILALLIGGFVIWQRKAKASTKLELDSKEDDGGEITSLTDREGQPDPAEGLRSLLPKPVSKAKMRQAFFSVDRASGERVANAFLRLAEDHYREIQEFDPHEVYLQMEEDGDFPDPMVHIEAAAEQRGYTLSPQVETPAVEAPPVITIDQEDPIPPAKMQEQKAQVPSVDDAKKEQPATKTEKPPADNGVESLLAKEAKTLYVTKNEVFYGERTIPAGSKLDSQGIITMPDGNTIPKPPRTTASFLKGELEKLDLEVEREKAVHETEE